MSNICRRKECLAEEDWIKRVRFGSKEYKEKTFQLHGESQVLYVARALIPTTITKEGIHIRRAEQRIHWVSRNGNTNLREGCRT